MSEIRGTYTALVTPFAGEDDGIDFDGLKRLLRAQADGGVRGVVPCGTTGESPVLSDSEHQMLVERTIEIARPMGMEVIAGAGSNATSHAVELNRVVGALGVDAALHVAPYYNRPSQEGLYAHFMSIADSAEHPIVLYDVPARTGVRIAPETIERLADHPNIRGLKAAGGSIDDVTEVQLRCDIAVLSGDDTLTLPMIAVGARGVISVLSNVAPRHVASMCTAALEGRWIDARELHAASFPLARALLELDSNPVPVKTALEILGFCSGTLRLPLVPPSPAVREEIARVLEHSDAVRPREVLEA